MAPIVICSNRAPVTFRGTGEDRAAVRGSGGLVSGLAPLMEGTGGTWIAAAASEGDREVARAGAAEVDGINVWLIDIDAETQAAAYDVIGNQTLWYAHHGLFESARRPRFDRAWHDAWAAFEDYSRAFAEALIAHAPLSSLAIVNDYHLSLIAPLVAEARPELRLIHFSHTPFAAPIELRMLPDAPRRQMLESMATFRACGFHSRRWADHFDESCRAEGITAAKSFVAPLATDVGSITEAARSPEADAAYHQLSSEFEGQTVIARVDRLELSKNILRGFLAFELLLDERSDLRNRVSFVARLYPSRQNLADYLAYRQEVEGLVDRINARFETETWRPIHLQTTEGYSEALGLMRRYDVLLVNPVRDGLNLVANEGPLVNERDGLLCLSREAGLWDALVEENGDWADGQYGPLTLHPFDVIGTAQRLAEAVDMSPADRRDRAAETRRAMASRSPVAWLDTVASHA